MIDILLVDTNIVSFLFKGDSRATLYAPYLEGKRLAISFMTVAELFQWAYVRHWGPVRWEQLEQSLKSYVVLPFDVNLCRLWGKVRSECRAKGHPISPQDVWIAATALEYDLALVTHNPSDFESVAALKIIAETSYPSNLA
jgi:predicted nucleic acid-binding protein